MEKIVKDKSVRYIWSEEDINLLKFWYIDCKLSLEEIAEGLDISYSAVKNETNRLGIQRTTSEAVSLQQTKLWRTEDFRNKMSLERATNEDRKESTRQTMLYKWANDPEYRENCSIGNSRAKKEAWKDPNYVRKMYIAWQSKPNSKELILQDILNENFPNQWKFTGVGDSSIDGHPPDFMHISKKLIIQHNGCFWHHCSLCGYHDAILPRGDTWEVTLEKDRKAIEAFKNADYLILIIWEHELKDINQVVNKIKYFVEGK